ncbi:MAG: dihydroorotate dehydrogenase-like protein [Spirochaetaceae bacterium]|nr:dihydroorotate dehydrogenase-like protein [Spirochaetaceae bacterium]
MADLTTCYMGIELANPLVVAASGLTSTAAGVAKAARAGAGAIVLKSLFEEQIAAELDPAAAALDAGAHPESEAFLARAGWDTGAADYIKLIREAKKASEGVPVIASINCKGAARWAEFAGRIQEAGADGLELNIAFMPESLDEKGAAIEELVIRSVREARAATKLPLAVKLGSSYTNLGNIALALEKAGAQGLVLFNRFFRLDVDLDKLALTAGPIRSSPDDYCESLRWISILYDRVGCDVAAGTGVYDAEAALRLVLAGASAVQLCSVLYRRGWAAITEIRNGMASWMDAKGELSVAKLKGRLCQWKAQAPKDYLRLQYIQALTGIS